MSQKWRRSLAWDDRFFPPAAAPLKFVLRAFSSIWLAVILLVLVALYGILASVPIGIVALAPTFAVYGLTVLLAIGVIAGLPVVLVWRLLRRRGPALRFAVALLGSLALVPVGVWLWWAFAWPSLHYDPATGGGLRFFPEFIERTKAITLRRVPGVEMSELEFYSWWPLRLILLAFVTNMVIATVRRIEFTFKNIGVLTVHTGIVLISLGSAFYNARKLEGDTVLVAGTPDRTTGSLTVGPPQNAFFDNTRVALHVTEGPLGSVPTQQRLLSGIPRYNDYNVGAIVGDSAIEQARQARPWAVPGVRDEGPLSIDVPSPPSTAGGTGDYRLRVVGYASYAEPWPDFVKADPAQVRVRPGSRLDPVRFVYLSVTGTGPDGSPLQSPDFSFIVHPAFPSGRVKQSGGDGSERESGFSLEYTMGPAAGMPEGRWRDLSEPVPPGTSHALVIEIPGEAPLRLVRPISLGDKFTVGGSGYQIEVKELHRTPPFPIISPGYEKSQSSLAVLRITTPEGVSFDRWVYHRFPEISQDLLEERNERGMPKRRAADASIRVSYIDASDRVGVYLDESAEGPVRAIVREGGGVVRVLEGTKGAGGEEFVLQESGPRISLRLGERWEHSKRVDRPRVVASEDRNSQDVGTHARAMLGVEVLSRGTGGERREIVWLPFTRYPGMGQGEERTVELADGRVVTLAFTRVQHPLPSFRLQLVDFQMIAYDHRGAPRDYQSVIQVVPVGEAFAGYTHVASLNAPLQAPFQWSDDRGLFSNVIGRAGAGLSPGQFKFSQAGWDAQTWNRSQAEADAGRIPKPYVTFTILQVGNNPGIHVVALGGILMGLGIPWAFYVKPWLVRREKARIQREIAAGTYVKPGTARPAASAQPAPPVGAQS
jgi:hypothetical protein